MPDLRGARGRGRRRRPRLRLTRLGLRRGANCCRNAAALIPSGPMEDQPTRVLDRTTRLEAPPRQGGRPPRGGRSPGVSPTRVQAPPAGRGRGRRARLHLLIVLIASVGGGDPVPKSTPADLGVGGGPTINTPTTSREKATQTDTGAASWGTAAPTTPPATGGTGGTTATPVTPTQPQGNGGGVGQAPAQRPRPRPPARAAAPRHRRAIAPAPARAVAPLIAPAAGGAASARRGAASTPSGGGATPRSARSLAGGAGRRVPPRGGRGAAREPARGCATGCACPAPRRARRPEARAIRSRCSRSAPGRAHVEDRLDARGGDVCVLPAGPDERLVRARSPRAGSLRGARFATGRPWPGTLRDVASSRPMRVAVVGHTDGASSQRCRTSRRRARSSMPSAVRGAGGRRSRGGGPADEARRQRHPFTAFGDDEPAAARTLGSRSSASRSRAAFGPSRSAVASCTSTTGRAHDHRARPAARPARRRRPRLGPARRHRRRLPHRRRRRRRAPRSPRPRARGHAARARHAVGGARGARRARVERPRPRRALPRGRPRSRAEARGPHAGRDRRRVGDRLRRARQVGSRAAPRRGPGRLRRRRQLRRRTHLRPRRRLGDRQGRGAGRPLWRGVHDGQRPVRGSAAAASQTTRPSAGSMGRPSATQAFSPPSRLCAS